MSNQYIVVTNEYSASGKWEIFADEIGTRVGSYESPDDVRGHLCDIDVDYVSIDADGNGSIVTIPVDWIGDGEKLVGSHRVLSLIETMSQEQMKSWIENSISFATAEVVWGRVRIRVPYAKRFELAGRLARVAKEAFNLDMIEICIYDAPFHPVGSVTRNPAVDGHPSVMMQWTTVTKLEGERMQAETKHEPEK